MNITTKRNKSDYKITDNTKPLQQQQQFISDIVTDTDIDTETDNDTNTNRNNNNRNTNNNNNQNINQNNNNNNTALNSHTNTNHNAPPSRFAPLQSSPSLEDSTNTISVATINVRGINNITKFENILEDLINKPVSIIGMQETKLSEVAAWARHKEFAQRFPSASLYKSYWDFDPNDRAAGVGLIIADYISKYVQRI